MTPLDLTLTPAQWEHWDRHGWTLVPAPTTECICGGDSPPRPDCPGVAPVPATVPCPECEGSRSVGDPGYTYYGVPEPGSYEPCPRCMDDHGIPTGVVPRVVGIVRPEQVVSFTGGGRWVPGVQVVPAERVGTATVTAVPVVDVNGPWPQNEGAQFVTVGDGLVMLYTADRDADEGYDGEDLSGYGPTDPPLFATPPAPGTTVWRLDRNEER